MKKLSKLSINPEKVIKNEELVNLRGGGYNFSCDPDAGVMCMGDCFKITGASGKCKNTLSGGKFTCTCE